jgi:hypothetical protein
MLRRVAPQNDVEGGQQFSVAFLSTAQHNARAAAQIPRAIIAFGTVDSVGTEERRDEWLAPAESFFAMCFDGTSLPVSHLNALVSERHSYPSQASLGQVPGPREQSLTEY